MGEVDNAGVSGAGQEPDTPLPHRKAIAGNGKVKGAASTERTSYSTPYLSISLLLNSVFIYLFIYLVS